MKRLWLSGDRRADRDARIASTKGPVEYVAALFGVGRTTVQRARKKFLKVEEPKPEPPYDPYVHICFCSQSPIEE